jgi:protein-disulfide isomerase
MSKPFWAIIAIIIVVFGGILFFQGDKANAPSKSNAQPTQHVQGEGKSKVTLVEYGDYQCPYCGAFHPIVKEVVEKYKDQITFQFRNLPLIQIHTHAMAAARAAEAASMQGKFWEMHNMIYEGQNTWSTADNPSTIFEGYAKQIGLKIDQFKKDSSGSATNDTINADVREFNKLKLEMSTPTFILDGKKVTPTYTVEAFSKLIDDAIAAKQKEQ